MFRSGLNCSQAVFSVFGDELLMEEETMMRIAGGFGGGVGGSGMICGAVSGAVMAIGLKYGAVDGNDTESKAKTKETVRNFLQKFSAEFGAVDCKSILGYDLNKPEEHEYVHNNNLTKTICPKFVEFAVKELEKII